MRALRHFRPRFLDDGKLTRADRLARGLARLGMGARLAGRLAAIRPFYRLLQGEPVDDALAGAHWRVRGDGAGKTSPIDGHAGIFWAAPILPAQGEEVARVARAAESILCAHGFDPLLTFTLLSERAVCAVIHVAFDRRDSAEVERARACHAALASRLRELGHLPYRVGPGEFSRLGEGSQGFFETVARVKRALDPDGVIAPGRYQPSPGLTGR
jgi:4-cresol dehydrogenase (hydroxylating)